MTRYERHIENFLAFLQLACIVILARRFVRSLLELAQGMGKVPFFMTSWHRDEPTAEVVILLLGNTSFDEHRFRCVPILQLSADSEVERNIRGAAESDFRVWAASELGDGSEAGAG